MSVLTTSLTDRIRLVIAWWTVTTWALYVASFLTFFSGENIAWFVLALSGLVGGVMALGRVPGWRPTLLITYGLVLAWSLIYWLGLVEKILIHEDEKTLAQALLRLGQMVSLGFSTAIQHGGMLLLGALSTFYREIMMPILQVVAVVALTLWALSRRSVPPNPTVERDARKSGARPSP
jgi:hypothetical protein